MSERENLFSSLAETIADYREDDPEIAPATERVKRWISQFESGMQLPILREVNHVLKKTYFSRAKVFNFLANLFQTKNLVGDDPCAFWMGVKFLEIQGGGTSQKDMLVLFGKILSEKCGFKIDVCAAANGVVAPGTYVYLDDAIFTGNRIRRDIEKWIENNAPAKVKILVITVASHAGGSYYSKENIRAAGRNFGKNIDIAYWRAIELEDRRRHTDTSDVLRPVEIPADRGVEDYVANMHGYPPHLRNAGNIGKNRIFSSDEGRQVLEQEFLKAGVRIREMCPLLGEPQRPLGNTILTTLGFGSLIVTFRNCPNNAPLALWAGEPWYPLFPRKTN